MPKYRVGIEASTWWNNRGFGRFTRELVTALAARSSEFEYTLLIDQPADDSLPTGVDTVRTGADRPITESAVGAGRRTVGDLLGLAPAVVRSKLDLLFFPSVYSYSPYPPVVPSVITFHDTIAEQFPHLTFPSRKNFYLWQAKCTLARWQAKRILTVSEASAEALHKHMGIARDRLDVTTEDAAPVFYPRTDKASETALRQRYGLDTRDQLLVYAGGLNPHKNIVCALHALPAILKEHPQALLTIVGDTSGKGFHDNVAELRALAAQPSCQGRVKFLGYVPDDDLATLLSHCSAFVFPSYCEGFGLPVLEAMACGAPVVVSDQSSLPEVGGDAALYFEPDSHFHLAAHVCRILADPGLRAQMRAASLERRSHFSNDRAAELTEVSFRRALAG